MKSILGLSVATICNTQSTYIAGEETLDQPRHPDTGKVFISPVAAGQIEEILLSIQDEHRRIIVRNLSRHEIWLDEDRELAVSILLHHLAYVISRDENYGTKHAVSTNNFYLLSLTISLSLAWPLRKTRVGYGLLRHHIHPPKFVRFRADAVI